MLAEIAAANAAFAVIKTAIQNGRELADVAHKVGDYVNATEDLRRKGEQKKKNPFYSGDLEEFMHLEKLKQQEEELKQLMIYAGRPGLWMDWQKFQAEARVARQRAREQAAQRRKQVFEYITIGVGVLMVTGAAAALVRWIVYLKGLS